MTQTGDYGATLRVDGESLIQMNSLYRRRFHLFLVSLGIITGLGLAIFLIDLLTMRNGLIPIVIVALSLLSASIYVVFTLPKSIMVSEHEILAECSGIRRTINIDGILEIHGSPNSDRVSRSVFGQDNSKTIVFRLAKKRIWKRNIAFIIDDTIYRVLRERLRTHTWVESD